MPTSLYPSASNESGSWQPLLWVWMSVIWCGSFCLAETGNRSIRRDTRGRVGFDVEVDNRWVDAAGYRVTRFRIISTAGGFQRDRELRLVIQYSPSDGTENFSISKPLKLARGDRVAETTLLVPRMGGWDTVTTRVIEGAEEWPEFATTTPWFSGGPTAAAQPLLLIDSDAPTRAEVEAIFNNNQPATSDPLQDWRDTHRLPPIFHADVITTGRLTPNNDANTLSQVYNSSSLMIRQPAEIPSNWIGYSCFSYVMISVEDLASTVKNHPERWRALSKWCRQGGTLFVYEAGAEFQRLSEIEQLLGMRALTSEPLNGLRPDKSSADLPAKILRGWHQERGVKVMPTTTSRSVSLGRTVKPRFVWRSLDLGFVVALNQSDVFPDVQIQTVVDNLSNRQDDFSRRHGFWPEQDNLSFFDQMIPGVGLPPVTSFLLLITVFVVMIGPINYLYLRRIRRLYLLLVTVPLGAMLVTFSLFAYAILSDGLGVQVRTRSVTFINQRNDVAVTWSRQTYYAAMRPSGGLSFEDDTAVYQISAQRPLRTTSTQKPTLIRSWTDGQQVFRRGYLKSRTPAQFMLTRARESEAEIAVNPNPTGDANLQIRNRLGTSIQQLLVRNAEGRFYYGEQVPESDELFELTPITISEANARLRVTYNSDTLSTDKRYERRQRSLNRRQRRSRRRWNRNNAIEQEKSENSLLERQLYKMQIAESLTSRSYLAVVKQSPFVPYGVKRPRHVMGLHIVKGTW